MIRKNKSGYKIFTDRYGITRSVHKRVVEKKMGDKVRRGYEVHHIDGNKNNNRPSNLTAIQKSYHKRIHGFLTFLI